jgi:hypothetical protein
MGWSSMPHYYIEGLFANKRGVKKKLKTGTYPANTIEPYAKTIWANSPQEAIQIATTELEDGEWTDGPRLSPVTEEQRMRSLGAPEFPGMSTGSAKSKKRQ